MKGYIAITTVLIVSFVVLAITATVTFLSIGEAQSSLALVKGGVTLGFVEGCVEDALLKSRNNATYGGGTLIQPEGSCIATISKVGNRWTMDVSASAGAQYQRTIEVIFDRNPNGISLVSWNEI